MKLRNPVSLPCKPNYLALFVLFLALFGACSAANKSQEVRVNSIPRIVFVQVQDTAGLQRDELNDASSLLHSLKVAGLSPTLLNIKDITIGKLQQFDIIVLPHAAAQKLSNEGIKIIAEATKSGINLMFDGESGLNNALGIKLKPNDIQIVTARDLQYPGHKLYWNVPCHAKPVDLTNQHYQVLCIDDTTKLPIGISSTYGKGKFIYYTPLFDPITDKGYTRFPFLIETLYNTFGFKPILERQAMEMYFDPGNRSNDTLSVQELAKFWRKNKVKRIFAAGWYYDTDYNYAELIKACHNNGILVLCWFETPMISTKFWEKHPEWREKTVFQRDAHIDWRYLMNLADTNCRKQVFKEFNEFLMKQDFDGLDFAELYFEPSPVGPELPENFTPMNSVVRDEFTKQGGFDPVLLFDTNNPHYWRTNNADWKKFANYRKDLLFRLKKHFLDFFTTVQSRKKDFEVMLTVLDVSITPELSDYIGEDTENSLALYKLYNITLQEEDPSNCWGLTPERYDKMGQLYRKYVRKKNNLLFDCNVVSAHEKGYGGFPAEVPTGEEIRQIAYNMELHDVRPVFYSEDVVTTYDYKNISTILANKAKVVAISNTRWQVNSTKTVILNIGNATASVKMDGQPWQAGQDSSIIVPAGKHEVLFSATPRNDNELWIKSVSGELNAASFKENTCEFSYTEDVASCYVILNKKPQQILIDHKNFQGSLYKNEDGEFVLKLPQGKHKVNLQ